VRCIKDQGVIFLHEGFHRLHVVVDKPNILQMAFLVIIDLVYTVLYDLLKQNAGALSLRKSEAAGGNGGNRQADAPQFLICHLQSVVDRESEEHRSVQPELRRIVQVWPNCMNNVADGQTACICYLNRAGGYHDFLCQDRVRLFFNALSSPPQDAGGDASMELQKVVCRANDCIRGFISNITVAYRNHNISIGNLFLSKDFDLTCFQIFIGLWFSLFSLDANQRPRHKNSLAKGSQEDASAQHL
jgi:hypothetical protein